jgi:hypothetical protein
VLLELRYDLSNSKYCNFIEKIGMAAITWVMRHPLLYKLGQKMMRLGLLPFSRAGWVKWMPSIPGKWTKVKDLPLPVKRSFISRMNVKEDQQENSCGR